MSIFEQIIGKSFQDMEKIELQRRVQRLEADLCEANARAAYYKNLYELTMSSLTLGESHECTKSL